MKIGNYSYMLCVSQKSLGASDLAYIEAGIIGWRGCGQDILLVLTISDNPRLLVYQCDRGLMVVVLDPNARQRG
jgi:hypothetical protein